MKSLQEIEREINLGLTPHCFNYTIPTSQEYENVDWSKVDYNEYQSFQYFEKRFLSGYKSIKGFDTVIQNMADLIIENNITPLDEINKKSNVNTNGEHTTISKQ